MWQLISVFILIVLPATIFFTIKDISINTREKTHESNKNKKLILIKNWKRSEVIKDLKFYIISLNMLSMPWIVTGIFIYQSFIAESKSWDIYVIPKILYGLLNLLNFNFTFFQAF